MIPKTLKEIFPKPDYSDLIKRLERPTGIIDVILDTDTYNEIDDQYALSYLLRSDDKTNVKAITAAPFYRKPGPGIIMRSDSPADGMEKSYNEIIKVLEMTNCNTLLNNVYRGSEHYLQSETQPVLSDAVDNIIRISQSYSDKNPLYIVTIGAITNIASALLCDPSLRERIVVIWLGGHSYHWSSTDEFNMKQDIAAARVVFGSGVPLVQFPCMGVVSEFRFSKPELEYWFRGKNKLCDYLIDNTYEFAKMKFDYEDWSKPLWDITPITWLLDGDFFCERLVPSPIPQYDNTYSFSPDRHPIKYIYYVKKDSIIQNVHKKLCMK